MKLHHPVIYYFPTVHLVIFKSLSNSVWFTPLTPVASEGLNWSDTSSVNVMTLGTRQSAP